MYLGLFHWDAWLSERPFTISVSTEPLVGQYHTKFDYEYQQPVSTYGIMFLVNHQLTLSVRMFVPQSSRKYVQILHRQVAALLWFARRPSCCRLSQE